MPFGCDCRYCMQNREVTFFEEDIIMKKNLLLVALTMVLALSAGVAQASLITVDWGLGSSVGSDGDNLLQSWLSGATLLGSDDFGAYAPNSVDTGSGFATSVGTINGYGHVGGANTFMKTYGEHGVIGDNYWSNAAPNSASLKGDFTLNLNAGIYQLGFYSIDFHDVGGEVIIDVNTAAGFQTFNLFDMTGVQTSGNEIFWLISSTEQITSINFHQAGNDGYAIDGLVAATPIPAAVWLLGTGLMGLLGFKRRRA